MDPQWHLGKGLSLPQLVFALNQELQRTAYSPSFTFDEVSQLDKATTTALTTIREWRNSFVPINRIPLDVLSLIPTHLSSHNDRFRASFVCRHWRRTFLQHAELWSELFLSGGEVYVKTLLGRAKGSPLDVFVTSFAPDSTVALLSARTKQIRCLDFLGGEWRGVQRFSEVNSGPLPLLRTLSINISREHPLDTLDSTLPSQPLFQNAVNLKVLRIRSMSKRSPSLTPLVFPNLVLFYFSTEPSEEFLASHLLDFLEASPMLRTVYMSIVADMSFEDVLEGRIVVLPNVKNFSLIMSDGGSVYEFAAHMSCPSVKFTSLMLRNDASNIAGEEIFPTRASWEAIVCQYTRNPVEEVTIEIKSSITISSKLTFRSTDATVVELRFKVVDEDPDSFPVFHISSEEVLAQATGSVKNHPQLNHVKRLHVCHSLHSLVSPEVSYIAGEVGRLFKSVGPLDQLTIYDCDLRPYLHSFLILEDEVEEPVVFPPIKELTIAHPEHVSSEECLAIVELAKSQHASGTPFERVVIRRESMFTGMEERLRPWVGSVEYWYEELHDDPWSPR